MAEDNGLKQYDVEIPTRGGVQRTTLQLSDADAEARGLKPKAEKSTKAKTPANKADTSKSNK